MIHRHIIFKNYNFSLATKEYREIFVYIGEQENIFFKIKVLIL